jgi:hypothetical protein
VLDPQVLDPDTAGLELAEAASERLLMGVGEIAAHSLQLRSARLRTWLISASARCSSSSKYT